MSQPKSSRKFRINVRAASILGIVVVIAVSGLIGLSVLRSYWGQSALLRQAKEQAALNPPKYDLAIVYLNDYLKSHPNDLEANEEKGKILAKIAVNGEQLKEAILFVDKALKLAPDGSPDPTKKKEFEQALRKQALRKQLVEMYLQVRMYASLADMKLNTAEEILRELVKGPDPELVKELPSPKNPNKTAAENPEVLRLLARVLEIRGLLGNEKSIEEAVLYFEKARKLDPLDVISAEELSQIYHDPLRLNRPDAALAVLDKLIVDTEAAESKATTPAARAEASQRVGKAHLARYSYFAQAAAMSNVTETRKKLGDLAADEINLALKKAPDNLGILLTASQFELQRGDTAKARAYFDRIPADPQKKRNEREEMNIRLVQGLIDLGENQAEDAIENWQLGLIATGGTNADLTWRLAYVLLQMGRVADAEPLIQQYRRLSGGEVPTGEYQYLEGLKLLKQNQPAKAIKVLTEAIPKINQANRSKLRYTLGLCYEAIRDESSAIDQYTESSKDEPKWIAPRLARAKLLQVRRPIEADKELKAIESDLRDDTAIILTMARAELLKQLGRAPATRNWVELNARIARLEAIDPAAPGLALLKGDLLVNTGKVAEAAALMEQAVRHDKNDPNLWVAWAGALSRLNKTQDALRVLEQASAPDAAGDLASLRIVRSRLLTALGHGQDARDALIRDEDKLRPDQRPQVWAELGAQLQQRREIPEARKAYEKWASLLPDDPQPRLVLLELAIADGDREATKQHIAALEKIGGPEGLYYRVARVQDLLRETLEGKGETPEARAARYREAEDLINKIERDSPQDRHGYVLRGLLHERKGETDKAISAYERSLSHSGGQPVVNRLVLLYTKSGRFADLESLRNSQAQSATAIDQLTADTAFKLGNKEIAEKMADQLVAGDPDNLNIRFWQARMLNSMGKPEEAERSLREMVRRHTEDPGPWIALLYFQVGRKQMKEALTTVEQIRQKVKNVDQPEFFWAQCYRLAGDIPKAEENFKAALAKTPNDPRVIRGIYAFYVAINRANDGEIVLRDYIKRAPDQRWAVHDLALLLSARPKDLGSWQEAWNLLKDTSAEGGTPEDRYIRAVILTRHPDAKTKYDEAAAILEKLNEDLPANRPIASRSRELLSRIYVEQGKKDKASELAAVNAADLSNPIGMAVYAESLIRDNKLDDAERQLNRLANLAPDDMVTIKLRALLLKARGQVSEAVALLEKVMKDRSKTDEAEGVAREVLTMFGAMNGPVGIDDPKSAERIGRQVSETWPASSWMLARILFRAKAPEKEIFDLCDKSVASNNERDILEACRVALSVTDLPNVSEESKARADAILTAAVKKQPTNPEMLLMTAYLRHKQGRYEEEAQLYRATEAARPSNLIFLNNLAWTLCEDLHRPQEALEVISSLIGRIGEGPQILDTRASILYRLDRAPEAIKDLQKVLATNPDNPTYVYHLARAYLKAGDEAKFRETLASAKKLGLTEDKVEPSEREELKQLLAK